MRMEPKSKLVATASFGEGRGGCIVNESKKDRLSNLPDEIVHHILSSSLKTPILDIEDLTMFSCVSKRCRQLVLSNPTLCFDGFQRTRISTCSKRSKLMNSFDRLLACRGDCKLQVFDVSWNSHYSWTTPCFCEDNKFRVFTWIYNVLVRYKVETLHVFIEHGLLDDDHILPAFPSYIFHCDSLRSLKVDVNCMIQAPSFAFSSNLRSLVLTSVTIVDEEFFKWISCCCKFIEDLCLDSVYGPNNVTIESSSLELFHFKCAANGRICHLHISGEKLKEIAVDWSFNPYRKISFGILAPNLKRYRWTGNLINHPNLGNLVSLEEAEIRLKPKLDGWDNVLEILCRLRGVKVFLLTEEVTKTSGFNMRHWKLQDPALFNQLKEFTIELWGEPNGIELARYILEHAQNLEKMVIVHLPQHSHVKRELSKSKTISNAKLFFSTYT
ncbi:putative F-box domain, FBD domain, leucine-rich repeat domain, L domain-containing protein [Rosa chinensis]|uniref:Putative F-box domain, FBD domain, leucine-rich repeat domain, L domain-containing protein n=1 Tax=Rosa chinensis TaxID=74649 RepID=A0A2P6RC28_ROSCH|nr:uncharacterized protein LOC112193450 [Rosa chinensis]PRQ43977.1 putative F-box domain, FBD domain, leucine-rich repeat domain, L domain-containing protein [Rosa chinensis]